MEKFLPNLIRNFIKIIIFTLLLGIILGFVCSSGIFTINYHPDATKKTLKRASKNFKTNSNAVIEYLKSENQGHNTNQPENSNDSEVNSEYKTPTLTYYVRPGETLYDIGQKYGVHWKALMRINNITDPDNLHPNDKLIIPLRSKYSI